VISIDPPNHTGGLTLRQAAMIAGFAVLIMLGTAPFANFFAFPKLVVHGRPCLTLPAIAGSILPEYSLT
jgi:hypothetical protein